MKYKILVIDDERLIRLSLREGLTDFGYEVETAAGIREGLEAAERFFPHFVLLDNRLGEDRGASISSKRSSGSTTISNSS